MVLGTVQPSVSPWCPSTAMDTRRAQQGHSSVVAPLGRAAGKGSPGQQDALRWPFLAQNHLSGFFPAVLLLHPSSPFTPINHLHSFAATFEELVTIGLEFCIPPTLGCPAVWIFPFSLRHATPAAAEASLPPPPSLWCRECSAPAPWRAVGGWEKQRDRNTSWVPSCTGDLLQCFQFLCSHPGVRKQRGRGGGRGGG